jgi:hypothetical protein
MAELILKTKILIELIFLPINNIPDIVAKTKKNLESINIYFLNTPIYEYDSSSIKV